MIRRKPAPFTFSALVPLAALVLGACAGFPAATGASRPPASVAVGTGAQITRAEETIDAPTHDIGARDGSRMYLLELYQKAMNDKDALALEVSSLHADIERRELASAQLERERDGLAAQVKALESERDALQAETYELAQRLVTAQIRRLEAEKLLLETLIEHKPRAEEPGANAAPAGGRAESSAPVSASPANTSPKAGAPAPGVAPDKDRRP